MGQQRRNSDLASSASEDDLASKNIHDLLQHFRLVAEDPANPLDPVRFLGRSLQRDCCDSLIANLSWDASPCHSKVPICTFMDAAQIYAMVDTFTMNILQRACNNLSGWCCIHWPRSAC